MSRSESKQVFWKKMKNDFEPYYAVIFTNRLRDKGDASYYEMAKRMGELAKQQEGFIGIETAREEIGITVSYWKDVNAIKHWKMNAEHQIAQEMGMKKWYSMYHLRIAKIEREYEFHAEK